MPTLKLIPSRPAKRMRTSAARLRRGVADGQFTPLIDAKAASRLLGIPPSWLLAQARAGRVPHHRLGHYVRFSAEDLKQWLADNRITPDPDDRATTGGRL